VPWLVDEESCDVLRLFTRLKHQLMPYLFAKAIEATETGVPVMRAMVIEHPDDPACPTLDRQYHLGESLLVAPVFTDGGEVDFYLPDCGGLWTDLLSGTQRAGGRWYRETHGFLSLPVYVRPGTVLPWGAEGERPDYDYAQGVTLRVFELADGATASFVVPTRDGGIAARGTVQREGNAYTARVAEGALRDWSLHISGHRSPVLAQGDTLDWTKQ
jgi:alpha-D-xyloside xylohydrolase